MVNKTFLRRVLTLTLSLVMLLTVVLPTGVYAAETIATIAIRGEADYKIAFEVLDIVNAERKKVGKAPLVMDKIMMEYAMQRAAECSIYYGHTRPSNEPWHTIIEEHWGAAENVAAGYTSATSVMDGWMNSSGHRSNILDEKNYGYRSIGIGVFQVDGIYYWCQLFNGLDKKSDPTQKQAVTKTFSIQASTSRLNLSISHSSLTLKSGSTTTLKVKNVNQGFPYYYHTLDSTGLSFTSANTNVATVSATGLVTPVGTGSTTITVKSANGVTLFTVPVTAEVKATALNATLTHTTGGKPKVTWDSVPNATSYRIYKSVYSGGKWSSYTLFKKAKTVTSCTDTEITSGIKVKYRIYAYNGSQRITAGETVTTRYLAQPKVSVSNASNGVDVKWDAVAGASYYRVYRSVYSGGKWSKNTYYTSTKSTTYTDTAVQSGQKVRYTVYARYGDSTSTYKTGVSITYLAKPVVSATKVSKGVNVSWNTVKGASYYRIYKSTYSGGTWSSFTLEKSTSKTNYTDTAAKGKNVRYVVRAVYGSNTSYVSNITSASY